MQILTQTKAQVRTQLGSPLFAPNLIGVSGGESASEFRSAGFSVTVGFFPGGARYAAFRKLSGGPLSAGDLSTVRALIGPTENWGVVPATATEFTLREKLPSGPVEALGYYAPPKVYAFFHLPGLLFDRRAIDAKMPGGTSSIRPQAARVFGAKKAGEKKTPPKKAPAKKTPAGKAPAKKAKAPAGKPSAPKAKAKVKAAPKPKAKVKAKPAGKRGKAR